MGQLNFLQLPVYIHVVLLINFWNNLNYTSILNIQEVMEFYNLANKYKTFEKDFKFSLYCFLSKASEVLNLLLE